MINTAIMIIYVSLRFGSGFLSPSTGIILNDLMDDFSFPDTGNLNGFEPSRANFVRPGKRPLSSMCPTIILDENKDASMVLGAAGGMRITTAVAQVHISHPRSKAYATEITQQQVITRNLWLEEDIKSSIDAPRIHHQLIPMKVEAEESVSEEVRDFLASRGHVVAPLKWTAVVQGISRRDGRIYANSDKRKAGGIAGF